MIESLTYTIVQNTKAACLYTIWCLLIGNDPDSIDLDDFHLEMKQITIEWGELIELSLSDAYLKIFIRKLEEGRELALPCERVQRL